MHGMVTCGWASVETNHTSRAIFLMSRLHIIRSTLTASVVGRDESQPDAQLVQELLASRQVLV